MKAVFGFLLYVVAIVFLYLGRDNREEARSWNKRKKIAVQIIFITAAVVCFLGGTFVLILFRFF